MRFFGLGGPPAPRLGLAHPRYLVEAVVPGEADDMSVARHRSRLFEVTSVDQTEACYGRMLAEKQTSANEWVGVLLLSGRGDWTPLELFLAGIRGSDAGLRREIEKGDDPGAGGLRELATSVVIGDDLSGHCSPTTLEPTPFSSSILEARGVGGVARRGPGAGLRGCEMVTWTAIEKSDRHRH